MIPRVITALLVFLVAGVPASAVSAGTGGSSTYGEKFAEQTRRAGLDAHETRQLQLRVDEARGRTSTGTRQVSANEIVANDGSFKVIVPLPGERYAHPISSGDKGTKAFCAPEVLCLYDEPGYAGLLWEAYKCGGYNLGGPSFVPRIHDRLESYYNNQTPGTVSQFFNWEDGWVYKFGSTAPHGDPDLNRWGWGNMIDGVVVC